MTHKNNTRWIGIAMAAVLLFSLAFCILDEPPKTRSNILPEGEYTSEAGTLTFIRDSPVSPSGEAGYVQFELAPEYMYLLDGYENNRLYFFRLNERYAGSDTWYIYVETEDKDSGEKQEIPFLNFTCDKDKYTVTVQSADGGLIFRLD